MLTFSDDQLHCQRTGLEVDPGFGQAISIVIILPALTETNTCLSLTFLVSLRPFHHLNHQERKATR